MSALELQGDSKISTHDTCCYSHWCCLERGRRPNHCIENGFFFVMAYGTRTDGFRGNETAHSNAQLLMLCSLVAGYPTLGVPLHHVVLDLPWCGYGNACVAGTALESLAKVPRQPVVLRVR